jgi:hypothetical protein
MPESPLPPEELDLRLVRVLTHRSEARRQPPQTARSCEPVEDKIELIASGQVVAIIPSTSRECGLRPDLTAIPLAGVEPSDVVLVTCAGDRSRLVAAYGRYAMAHLPGV